MWNWRAMYLGRLIEPIAYFAFLAPGVAGLSGGPLDEYMGFVLSGMACLLAFRAATNTLSDVANDRKWGVFAIHHKIGRASCRVRAWMSAVYLLENQKKSEESLQRV